MATLTQPGFALGALLLALAAGCAVPADDIRHRNAFNLEKLETGMSRQQVDAIMGVGSETVTESIYMEHRLVDYLALTVENPYRSETREMGGDQWEELPTWSRADLLAGTLEFIVVRRGPEPAARDGQYLPNGAVWRFVE